MKKSKPGQVILANWGRRLIAWFIDYLIINILLGYFGVEQVESSLLPAFILPRLPGVDLSLWSPISVLVFFTYWTLSEWYFGKSLGQLLLGTRLVDMEGGSPSLKACAVQSVGKSLLLPFDCVAGWFFEPSRQTRQRFFNRLSNTIVILAKRPDRVTRKGKFEREP